MGFLATKPTMIITTLHDNGIVNAGVFGAYTGISPTQIAIAIGTSSHTYKNIIKRKEFVVNIPGADIVKCLKIIASDLPPEKSEVEEAGLNLKKSAGIKTPAIEECAAACEFIFEKEVPIGYHNLVIAGIEGGWIRSEFLDSDGRIDIFKARVVKDFKYPKPLYVLPGEVAEG